MPPKIILTYFPFEARALPIRLAFHIGGIEFEDRRVSFAEFGAMRDTLPLGQLPVLQVDGKTYTQTMAMARYACKLANLEATDPIELMAVHEISEVMAECLYKAPSHADETEKKRLREEYAGNKMKKLLKFVDTRIAEANKVHAVTDTVTEADLSLAMIVCMLKNGTFDYVPQDYTDQFPALTRAYDALMAVPAVKAYFALQDK
eukprot:m.32182 g.32182  ORF g.32182 m.32182 type:complete len:204 (-) comp12135_c0_seq4:87-698(-)